ncbi:MAG: type II toxin-antitoxin system PemK/MazF family toxin [Actinomycetes bacterium]|jgi:mRNA interferase MazF|nr:type II toxin-antitoxin system PemK/MazF family toxin [Actinomycetes bacterium]
MPSSFVQGDIVEFNFNPTKGHEPAGRRPALVVSRDKFNLSTSMPVVCPISTRNNGYPLHFRLPENCDTKGFVLCEQMRSVDLESRDAKVVEHLNTDGKFMLSVICCLISFW